MKTLADLAARLPDSSRVLSITHITIDIMQLFVKIIRFVRFSLSLPPSSLSIIYIYDPSIPLAYDTRILTRTVFMRLLLNIFQFYDKSTRCQIFIE